MTALLSIPIASYWSIKRLALKYFHFVQQDQKLIGIGITYPLKNTRSGKETFLFVAKQQIEQGCFNHYSQT
ncbi:hypothetical protein CXF85_16200 [Colwellia sp. 75C3]|nr:hypothetical protein CXF85_16200 [Colwellia sp. 75C3]